MFYRLALLFIVVPLVELSLLMYLAEQTGWKWTLGLVIFTGMTGAWLAKRQGWKTWQRISEQLSAGQMPAEALGDAMMIFVAGALLLTPGILTDAFGFSLLFPPCRRLYRQWIKRHFQLKFNLQTPGNPAGPDGTPPRQDQIIDSYVIEPKDEE